MGQAQGRVQGVERQHLAALQFHRHPLAGDAADVGGRRYELDAREVGTVLDPAAAYAVGRGLKTLSARMSVHNANAQALAEVLAAHPKVA